MDTMIHRYVIGFLGILLHGFKNNHTGTHNILLPYMGFSFIDKCYQTKFIHFFPAFTIIAMGAEMYINK